MAADSNSIIKNLYSKFKYGDIVIRLLYLNIGVFLIISLCGLICTLFNLLPVRWVSYLMFPASVERFVYQPWSRCIPCSFQYDMAVLVRAFVLGFLFFQAFARTIYIRGCDGSFSLYAGLSCVSLFF